MSLVYIMGNSISAQLSKGTAIITHALSPETSAKTVGRLGKIFQSINKVLQSDVSLLTREQHLSMNHRLVRSLIVRAGYWLAVLLLASILTAFFSNHNPHPAHGLSTITWTLGVWLIGALPYIGLQFFVLHSRYNVEYRNLMVRHILILLWIFLLYSWWLLGFIGIEPHKFVPGHPPVHFSFSAQTFIFATLAGQFIPIVLLSPSIIAQLGILLMSFGAVYEFYHIGLIPNEIFVIWNIVQLSTYFIASLVIARDERRYHARSLIEEESTATARNATQQLNTFLGSLSHDIRSPLSAMSLTLALAKEQKADEELSHYIEEMKSQTTALETMMDSTLDLSRLVSGTWQVKAMDISLPELIGKIVSDIPDTARVAGVEFHYHTGPYIVSTDPTALARILRNLVGNAIRYTPANTARGPGRVWLESALYENEGIVRITIADNGIGIPSDKMSEIFKEFVQLNNPERNREKGFGLGLFIAKRLATLLDHKVGVESTVGEGSRFWIEVPYRAKLPEETVLDDRWFVDNSRALSGMTVALIEDDRKQREPMSAILTNWGCKVVAGESEEVVLNDLRKSLDSSPVPDFILSDYRLLERKKGTAAIEGIRKSLGVDIPAAIWTSDTRSEILQEIASHNFEYFSKPVDFRKLWELLKKYSPSYTKAKAPVNQYSNPNS
jgi:signal transduction histidine kinase